MTVMELFSGAGGWTARTGALALGPSVGLELAPLPCATAAAAGHRVIRTNVATYPAGYLRDLDGVIGSPPCTTFSISGLRAGALLASVLAGAIPGALAGRAWRGAVYRDGNRVLTAAWKDTPQCQGWSTARLGAAVRQQVTSAALMLEPARFIAAGRPRWVALEQVPAALPLFRAYADALTRLGYSTWTGVLNAADYGVPQTRRRAILIASLDRPVACPQPTHYDPAAGTQLFGAGWVTMATAIGWGATRIPAPTVTAGGTATGGAEPFPRRGRAALERERDAGRWIPHPGPNPTTVRPGNGDLAVLQSFPPGYPWQGRKGAVCTQIGNAVPPLLGAHVLAEVTGTRDALHAHLAAVAGTPA